METPPAEKGKGKSLLPLKRRFALRDRSAGGAKLPGRPATVRLGARRGREGGHCLFERKSSSANATLGGGHSLFLRAGGGSIRDICVEKKGTLVFSKRLIYRSWFEKGEKTEEVTPFGHGGSTSLAGEGKRRGLSYVLLIEGGNGGTSPQWGRNGGSIASTGPEEGKNTGLIVNWELLPTWRTGCRRAETHPAAIRGRVGCSVTARGGKRTTERPRPHHRKKNTMKQLRGSLTVGNGGEKSPCRVKQTNRRGGGGPYLHLVGKGEGDILFWCSGD